MYTVHCSMFVCVCLCLSQHVHVQYVPLSRCLRTNMTDTNRSLVSSTESLSISRRVCRGKCQNTRTQQTVVCTRWLPPKPQRPKWTSRRQRRLKPLVEKTLGVVRSVETWGPSLTFGEILSLTHSHTHTPHTPHTLTLLTHAHSSHTHTHLLHSR